MPKNPGEYSPSGEAMSQTMRTELGHVARGATILVQGDEVQLQPTHLSTPIDKAPIYQHQPAGFGLADHAHIGHD